MINETKNNHHEFFGQMDYRPPWQKIARTPMHGIRLKVLWGTMVGTNEILASKHDIAALKVKHRLRAVSYFSFVAAQETQAREPR